MKCPQSFDANYINNTFFADYVKYKTLKEINNGRCYDWSYLAHRLFPKVELWTTDWHAWVKVDNLHYDSEDCQGVEDFMLMEPNRRNSFPNPWHRVPPTRIALAPFKDFWNVNGGGRRKHWDDFLEPQLIAAVGDVYKLSSPILG